MLFLHFSLEKTFIFDIQRLCIIKYHVLITTGAANQLIDLVTAAGNLFGFKALTDEYQGMDRRIALKNLALILGSTIAMPGILKADERFLYDLKNLSLTPDQQQLVADIAETIIPETDTSGAKTLGLPAFVLKMLDECTPKATQDGFVTGAKAFPAFAEANIKKSFASATPDERTALLMKLEQNESNPLPEVLSFYRDIKKYTVFGYTNSKFFMTKQIVYQLVPGKYNPAYKITPAQHG